MANIYFFVSHIGRLENKEPFRVKGFKADEANLRRLERHFWNQIENGRCYDTFVAVVVCGASAAKSQAPAPIILVRRPNRTEDWENWEKYTSLQEARIARAASNIFVHEAKIQEELRHV